MVKINRQNPHSPIVRIKSNRMERSIESDNKKKEKVSHRETNDRRDDENQIYTYSVTLEQQKYDEQRRQHCTIEINWFQLLRNIADLFSGNF